jgi:fusaric acid resistance family protein
MPLSSQRTLVRRNTQPTAVYIARLAATATAAYLIALHLPAGTSRPVLAPLTALLVLQASLYQTIRTGIRKVIAVTAGVLAAVSLSAFVGFNWWLLGVLTAGTLLIGHVLQLGEETLDVPVSAIVIFSSGGHAAATGRLVDTLAGTAAGLIGGLIFAPLRVEPARVAVGGLARQVAALLDGMAGDLADALDPAKADGWLTQARALRGEIERVDDTLRQAEDSARLNPRALRMPHTLPASELALRDGLEALEHAALTIRFLTRTMIDGWQDPGDAGPVLGVQSRAQLAQVLGRLAVAIRTYGDLMQRLPAGDRALESTLCAELDEVRRQRDMLADLIEPRRVADCGSTEWALCGEILRHLDRLRSGLAVDTATQVLPRQRRTRQLARVTPRLRLPAGPAAGTARPLWVCRVNWERPRARRPQDLTPVSGHSQDLTPVPGRSQDLTPVP